MSYAEEAMQLWTIYCHPADYPDKYVARCWRVLLGQAHSTNVVLLHTDLDALRRMLPANLYCLPRNPADDPVIVETWV